jgi:acyl carrier protein
VDGTKKAKLRKFIADALQVRGDRKAFLDDDSLFLSGRLDSLSMMMLVVHLESTCGIDFADVDFDVELIDSLNDVENFVDQHTGKSS